MQFLIPANINVNVFTTKNEANSEIAKALNEVLTKMQLENKSVLLLLSGGSAFDIYPLIDSNVLSDKTTIGVLDERYSTDPKENNMVQLKATSFYETALKNGCQFIDTTVKDGETIEELETRFNSALSGWIKNNPDGIVTAIVGIGPDGHTSGMLPFPENPTLYSELFENPEKLAVHYDADGKNPYRYRVTTTNTFMRNNIDHAFVYAVGENKKDALTRLKSDTGDLPTTPARILREMKHVELFTDVNLN